METLLKGIQTEAEAIELANEIERVESGLKMMKDTLKEYVSKNGEIDTGEKVWSFHESTSWKFEADGLRKIAEGILLEGKNPWDYLNITAANLRKLDWPEEELKKIGKASVRRNFKGVKNKK